MRLIATILVVAALALAGCADDPAPTDTTPTGATPTTGTPPTNATGEPGRVAPMLNGTYRATIATSLGDIVVELYADKAPLHAANFLQYAEDGSYDGTVFHRVVKGFVIQGGGFSAPFSGDSSHRDTPNGPIPTEIWSGSQHLEGTLGMARTSDPNSATSQWFINTNRNTGLDSGYTVFGRVVEGMEVVDAIENTATTTRSGFQNVPTEDVVITKVTVESPSAPGAAALASYPTSVGLAAGGKTSIPVLVKNAGGQRFTPALQATATNGATTTITHEPGPLSAGQSGVAIVEVQAPAGFAGGELTVSATNAANGTGPVRVPLTKLDATGNAAGPEHPQVSTYYVGIYDNGVVFDTTRTDLAERGFTLPGGFRPHPAALKVYVGEGNGEGDYIPVIPGFASGIVGLKGGETRTVRLSSEEGYQDGYFRIFEMDVASVDS